MSEKPKAVVLGSMDYPALPVRLKAGVDSLKKARWHRTLPAVASVLGYTAAGFAILAKAPVIEPLIYSGTATIFAADSARHGRNVKQLSLDLGKAVGLSRDHPTVKHFISQGATHVFVDRGKNIHFVKAPHLKGEPFRPLVGRVHAPVG